MSENSKYSYFNDRPTADLLVTLTYLESLLPADADPVHRQRVAEIRERVLSGDDERWILRDPRTG